MIYKDRRPVPDYLYGDSYRPPKNHTFFARNAIVSEIINKTRFLEKSLFFSMLITSFDFHALNNG